MVGFFDEKKEENWQWQTNFCTYNRIIKGGLW